jgi:hypothetical protein
MYIVAQVIAHACTAIIKDGERRVSERERERE